jgi:hypothetical protein
VTSPLYLQRYPELRDYFTNFDRRYNRIAQNYLIRSQLVLHGYGEFFRNEIAAPADLEKVLKKIGFDENQVGPEKEK